MVRAMVFSPDGKRLATANFREIRLWEANTGKQLPCEFPSWLYDGDYVDTLAFSHDGKILAAGHEDAIGIWDVGSGRNIRFYDRRGMVGLPARLIRDSIGKNYPTIIKGILSDPWLIVTLMTENGKIYINTVIY